MEEDVKDWIRNVYGKELLVDGKQNHKTLVKAINQEDEKYKIDIRDYIVNRIKEIQIDKEEDNRSYRKVVRGVTKQDQCYSVEQNDCSDKEIVVTNNTSKRSNDSIDTLIDISHETMQTKIIFELQETMKKMQDDHKKLIKYIQLMEDTVITLVEEEGKMESYESAL